MSTGRLFLRKTIDGYGANTLVCRRGAPDGEYVDVSPWGDPDTVLTVHADMLVRRRPRGGASRPEPICPAPKLRTPLVYALPSVREKALKLLPERSVEVAIDEALRAGKVTRLRGGVMRVTLPNGIRVTLARSSSPISSRKSWLAISISDARREAA